MNSCSKLHLAGGPHIRGVCECVGDPDFTNGGRPSLFEGRLSHPTKRRLGGHPGAAGGCIGRVWITYISSSRMALRRYNITLTF